jgi:hypothetical protein
MENESESILGARVSNAPWSRHATWIAAAYALGRQVQDPNMHLASLLSTVERIAGNAPRTV